MDAWGCNKPSNAGFVYDLGGMKTKTCPVSMLRQSWVQSTLSLFTFYKRGITPNNRGLRGETAFYREVMAELEDLTQEAKAWFVEQKQARGKAK